MLKELKIHHKEIGRLRFQGYSPAQIADMTGAKVSSVYAVLRSELCKSFMAGLSDKADLNVINVREKLVDMNKNALDAMGEILSPDTNAPYAVILNAAKDVLDRNGYKVPEQHQHVHAHMTAADLLKLRERADSVDLDYLN